MIKRRNFLKKQQKVMKMNDAKKKQYRQRRTYIRTADSLGREACGITDASTESLFQRAGGGRTCGVLASDAI